MKQKENRRIHQQKEEGGKEERGIQKEAIEKMGGGSREGSCDFITCSGQLYAGTILPLKSSVTTGSTF